LSRQKLFVTTAGAYPTNWAGIESIPTE